MPAPAAGWGERSLFLFKQSDGNPKDVPCLEAVGFVIVVRTISCFREEEKEEEEEEERYIERERGRERERERDERGERGERGER